MNLAKNDRNQVLAVWFIGVILLWEAFSFLLNNILQDPSAAMKLPFPHEVVMTFVTNWKELLIAGGVTFSRAALGFSLGAVIGIVLAVVMSLSRVIEKIAFPYLIISQMIPVLGLAPIIFNIVRDMNTSRIVISAYITFFPVAANMLSGLKSVEQDKKDLLYSIAAGKVQVYKKLMFPYALPYLFSGLKIAAPMAVTASILVDMLGSSSGIGVKLLYSLYSNATDIFWASVITSAIMGILSHHLVVVIGKILLPWQSLLTKRVGDGT